MYFLVPTSETCTIDFIAPIEKAENGSWIDPNINQFISMDEMWIPG